MTTFSETVEKNLKKLEQFVPIVDRVHGESHPEFRRVHELFNEIIEKIKQAGAEKADLSQEFKELREVTNIFSVPEDVCETYEAVYNMLAELDKAYQDDSVNTR